MLEFSVEYKQTTAAETVVDIFFRKKGTKTEGWDGYLCANLEQLPYNCGVVVVGQVYTNTPDKKIFLAAVRFLRKELKNNEWSILVMSGVARGKGEYDYETIDVMRALKMKMVSSINSKTGNRIYVGSIKL